MYFNFVGGYCSVMVCLIHADLHQDHVISQLCHVMSTSVLVQRDDTKSTDGGSNGGCGLCSVTHQRKSGKVLRKVNHCCHSNTSQIHIPHAVMHTSSLAH